MPDVLICPVVLLHNPGQHTQILERAGFTVHYPVPRGARINELALRAALANADAVLAGPEPYTPGLLADFPRLRAICRAGVGYDAVDLGAATARGIAIGFTPGTNHDAVAEHTFALLLAVAKRIVDGHDSVLKGTFERRVMQPLRGRTLGILGLGRIGRSVAARARAFAMRVLAFDPYCGSPAPEGVSSIGLDELLAQADYLTIHAPHSEQTHHLIRGETLAKMKPSAVLINTSRGGLIDEDALADALASGRIGAVGLDVFENEPPVGSPLLKAPNVLFSPHVAGIDVDAVEQMAVMAAQTIVDLYHGNWPADRLVNADALGAGWKW